MPGTITASLPDASAEPCTLVPLYENSTRTGYEFEFLKRATRELPKLSYETVTPPILFCPVTTATCNTNMKTERKRMYRHVLERMVMAHFNNKLTVYAIPKVREDVGKELVCEKTDADERLQPKYLMPLACKDIHSGESDM